MQLQTPQGPQSAPPWNEGAEQRLFASMLLATLLVAGALSLIRLPVVPAWSPVVDLLVRIVNKPPAETPAEAQVESEPLPPAESQAAESTASPPLTMGGETLQESRAGTDWDTLRDEVVQEYLDREVETYGYFNPDLAEKRSRLAERYQPGTHEKPKPIWENVELDTLGRTVLRSGDCIKVLDDPNVGSREVFEKFGQFMVQCTYQGRYPRELPWVDDIRQRYEYLRNPGGYVEADPGE
jgi:hypothetical protein